MFSFTFSQSVKKKGYRMVTVLLAILLLVGVALAVYLPAKPDSAEEGSQDIEYSAVETVYVQDLFETDYTIWMQALQLDSYSRVDFIPVTDRDEAVSKAEASAQTAYVIVEVTWDENCYLMEAILPQSSTVNKSDADELLTAMQICFDTAKLTVVGLTEEQIAGVMTPMVTDYAKIGEDDSMGMVLVRMLAPMIFGLVLYMMLLLYGQDVSREVSIEKTSKLTETLLTSVKPYALITGKVLSVATAALLQFFIWIFSAVGGLLVGNALAAAKYPEYENSIITILNFVRDNVGDSAFSPMAVVLAILVFVIGFLFYCVLAGLAGCMVSKPEEVASTQALFQFPVIISFFVCYFGILLENTGLLTVSRFIPFTIPFSVPVDLLTGSISIFSGVISLAILLVFTVFTIILSGRLYEGLILYNGQKLNVKTMIKMIRVKK